MAASNHTRTARNLRKIGYPAGGSITIGYPSGDHLPPTKSAEITNMTNDLVCWKCGEALVDFPLPLSRRSECRACSAELHVCRLCEDFDPKITGGCREDRAEEVRDKERANFCDYFSLRAHAYSPRDTTDGRLARAQLEALFGGEPSGNVDTTPAQTESRSAADTAREELEKLFGQDNKPSTKQ